MSGFRKGQRYMPSSQERHTYVSIVQGSNARKIPHRLHPGKSPQQDQQFPLRLMSPRSSQESTSIDDQAQPGSVSIRNANSARKAAIFNASNQKFGESEQSDENS
ncbi:hypothetical protein FGO68_gene17689 [Halteria grandinella]|uniref:Uncharacterized protein n=1 Tax=Halteria grandinella TaxID=5974 RepID=A0A8J8P4Z3_HALGN|nr:hypothetical protein FGO68_gene17689 [Halteria grandinella]